MRSKRILLMMAAAILAAWVGAHAADPADIRWGRDPRTSAQVGYVTRNFQLTEVSWSGPAVQGMAHGKGALKLSLRSVDGRNQYTVEGEAELAAGLMDGMATLKYSDGESYTGTYRAGLKDGKGRYTYADGDSYDGDWKENLKQGRGVLLTGEGDRYEGEFKDDQMSGKGVFLWHDGWRLEGSFKDGRPNGYGVLTGPDGKVTYKGEWVNGERAPAPE